MRIIYFCNQPRIPSGGTNVIHRQVKQLNKLGISAALLPSRQGIKPQQSDEDIPYLSDHDIKENDYLIIPEISAAEMASKLIPYQLSFGIFVQNGYYISHRARECNEKDIDNAYQHASHIFSISNSTSTIIKLHYPHLTSRIQRVTCSIDPRYFYLPAKKEKLITYMPRKNAAHVNALIFALKKHLPHDWQLIPIDQISHQVTAQLLRQSAIFLSFSHLEGLGLPPIEAALCGNYVIGYHGGGGLNYWCAPNFETIEVGELTNFVAKIKYRVAEIERQSSLSSLLPAISHLQQTFSLENELHYLRQLSECAKASVARKANRGISIHVQNREGFLHKFLGRRHTRNRKSGWQTSDI